jgi:transcriptional regulator with XRE-family HTH domain
MPQPRKRPLPPLSVHTGSVAERIVKYRKLRGLTQKELAERIGITRDMLASYELGRARLNDEITVRFALALKVSTDALLGLKDSNRSEPKISVRVMRRIKRMESLPEGRKKLVLRMIDELIRSSS